MNMLLKCAQSKKDCTYILFSPCEPQSLERKSSPNTSVSAGVTEAPTSLTLSTVPQCSICTTTSSNEVCLAFSFCQLYFLMCSSRAMRAPWLRLRSSLSLAPLSCFLFSPQVALYTLLKCLYWEQYWKSSGQQSPLSIRQNVSYSICFRLFNLVYWCPDARVVLGIWHQHHVFIRDGSGLALTFGQSTIMADELAVNFQALQ